MEGRMDGWMERVKEEWTLMNVVVHTPHPCIVNTQSAVVPFVLSLLCAIQPGAARCAASTPTSTPTPTSTGDGDATRVCAASEVRLSVQVCTLGARCTAQRPARAEVRGTDPEQR
ncbi:hypothetical protein DAEQUDRAFT_463376 [Daedalea quercina L-15889]|uniref:Uncharacterized protein n=1 Tax=Daedalea quercina L-15889 TaxID=1314783 RepID=A0A165TEA1_9APHY|nr:hypothetical protein DAEQUDRAFT_463376 [Daedalea quercina L-15889]